jgi:hypothetical protein
MEKSGVICSISIYKTTDENNKEKVVVVPQTVVVKAGELTGSTVYENIPLGAQYEVHEVR